MVKKKFLFIAEKPSLMRDIQAVYRSHREEICRMAGGEILFTALAGHVCRFAKPDQYSQWNKKWYEIPLPMVPDPWKIVVNEKTKDIYGKIVKMFRDEKCDGIIVGTDSDIEGNGIYYLLEHMAGWEKVPALRYFLMDQTEKGILKAFGSLTDIHSFPRDVHMTESWLLRSRYDWIIGMNMTVGVTVKQGELMKIGRVKAPALKLIYDNCRDINSFVPQTAYTVMADYLPGFNGTLIDTATGKPLEFKDRDEAEKISASIVSPAAVVKDCSRRKITSHAPKLFSLSALQVEAGKKFGYAPDQTLAAVQSLYERHKLMSYPRTDCRYISMEKVRELPGILEAVKKSGAAGETAQHIPENAVRLLAAKKMYVNDAEVSKSSHDALLPTDREASREKLTEREWNIYQMVARRLVAVLYPPLEEYKTVILAEADGCTFRSTGNEVDNPGWTVVEPVKKKGQVLPFFQKGDRIPIKQTYVHEKVSSPPKRYTEASLIEAMVHVSSRMHDSEYREVLEENKGIGTEATRGQIIHELKEAGYFKVIKQGIHITELGKAYVECLSGMGITDLEMTADMELHMKHVKEGSEKFHDVEKILRDNAIQMIGQVKKMKAMSLVPEGINATTCPACGSPLQFSNRKISCTSDSCKVSLSYKVLGKTIPAEQINKLFQDGKTDVIEGFRSEKGKTFPAILQVVGNEIKFRLPEEETDFPCPCCSRNLIRYGWGYGCSGKKDGSCGFYISAKIKGVKISDSQFRKLFLNGKTDIIKGFRSEKGSKYDARLVLDGNNGKVSFLFTDGEDDSVLKCPLCGKPVRKKEWGYCCSAYKNGCTFSLGYEIAGKKIPDKQARLLIMTGVSSKIKGFHRKNGDEFDAKLVLENGKVNFARK